MTQSKTDSLMEAVTNIVVGTAIYTVVNYLVLPFFVGVPISLGNSLALSGFYAFVSIVRSYAIRRAFNGRSVWEAIKGTAS